jgi:prefoldin alpha subunit
MSTSNLTPEVLKQVQLLQTEIEQLQMNLNTLEQQTALINNAIGSLEGSIAIQEELQSKTSGDEILLPIGGSNLILCTIKDPENVFFSLGSGITKKTTVKNAVDRNKSQIETLNSSIKKIQEQYSQFSLMLEERRQELVKIAQEHQILG